MKPSDNQPLKNTHIPDNSSSLAKKPVDELKKHYLYGLAIIIAINIGFYYGLILPMKINSDNVFKTIETKRSEAVIIKSPDTYSKLKADIEKFKDMLPQRSQMTQIVRELDMLAKNNALSIHDISFETKKVEQGDIFPLSFSFLIEGKYNNIKSFIYKLESSRRLITIDDLSLEKVSGKEEIRLKIRATIYLKYES